MNARFISATTSATEIVTVKRRWLSRATNATAAVFRHRVAAELAVFVAAMRAVFKWTMI